MLCPVLHVVDEVQHIGASENRARNCLKFSFQGVAMKRVGNRRMEAMHRVQHLQ